MQDREISEQHVQDALVALLQDVPAVGDGLRATFGHAPAARALMSVQRSVWAPNGESDVVAEWAPAEPGGAGLRLFIEVKIGAQFMPNQARRYRDRAESDRQRKPECDSRTILIAPAHYLEAGNVQIHVFDAVASLEQVLAWGAAAGLEEPNAPVALISETLRRLAEGRALGAKGLHPSVHRALADELSRRSDQWTITNNATDWVFLRHGPEQKGVRFRYRIGEGAAEVRLKAGYPGLPDLKGCTMPATIVRLQRGTETVFRHVGLRVSASARTGCPASADLAAIADALQELAAWWTDRTRRADEA